MRISKTLLIVGLFFVAFSAISATETEVAPDAVVPPRAPEAPLLGEAALVSLAGNCGVNADRTLEAGLPDATETSPFDFCGNCSLYPCAGVQRGQICYLGGGQGWGQCNIFTGTNLCSDGYYRCQCEGTPP